MESFDDGIKIRTATNADCLAVRQLVFGVLAEFDLPPDPNGTDRDLNDIETHYMRLGGLFEILVDESDRVVGSVGLHPLDKETVELRKMYLAKEVRGQGRGRKLLERTLENAKNLGYLRVYLETARVLEQAVHLYESFGFQPVDIRHTPRCDQGYMLELDRR